MPVINVSIKENVENPDQLLQDAKKRVTESGGKITNEFKLFKGFTAEFPDGIVSTLESNEKWDVEEDAEVRTQST